jgi:hypothetical protein
MSISKTSVKTVRIGRPYRSDLETVVTLDGLGGGGGVACFYGVLLAGEVGRGGNEEGEADEPEAGPA